MATLNLVNSGETNWAAKQNGNLTAINDELVSTIAEIPGQVVAEVAAQDIPGQVVAEVAAQPTVVDAAAAAVDDAMLDADIVYGNVIKSPYAETDAEGGFVGENGRITDLVVDASGAVIPDVIDRWAPRLESAGLIGGVDSSWYGGGIAGENGRATEVMFDANGDIVPETLSRWASRMAGVTVDSNLYMSGPDIAMVGDSLTADGYIRTRLATLSGRTVRNMGVGGETATTILARLGSMPWLMTPVGMTLPASGSVDVTFASSHPDGGATWPLLQGTGVREGDTYLWGTIAGTRWRLSIRVKDPAQDYPLHGAGDVYQLTRDGSGSAITLKRPEPFLPEYGGARSGDIIIAWIGQNGPSDAITQAGFESIAQWATKAGNRFLFMSKPSGDNTGWTDLEKSLLNRWGRRYCNVRRFLIDDAMPLLGLTPTAQDNTDIAAGRVPTSLRTDSTHHTQAAQEAIAEWLLYPRLQELEMI